MPANSTGEGKGLSGAQVRESLTYADTQNWDTPEDWVQLVADHLNALLAAQPAEYTRLEAELGQGQIELASELCDAQQKVRELQQRDSALRLKLEKLVANLRPLLAEATKGPWKFRPAESPQHNRIFDEAGKSCIAQMELYVRGCNQHWGEMNANAALIVAAVNALDELSTLLTEDSSQVGKKEG